MTHPSKVPPTPQFENVVFIPSHLTKFLVAGGVGLAASGVAVMAWGYAFNQLSKVRSEEVIAMIKGC